MTGCAVPIGHRTREKEAHLAHIAELRPYLLEATGDVMKARGMPVLSSRRRTGNSGYACENAGRKFPIIRAVLRDVADGDRISWRGAAGELREVLREVIDQLSPDNKVRISRGVQLE